MARLTFVLHLKHATVMSSASIIEKSELILRLKQLENGMLSILTDSLKANCDLLGLNFLLVVENKDKSQQNIYGDQRLG